MEKGTAKNCNSKRRTPPNQFSVENVMDRYAVKEMADPFVSPVNSSKRNLFGLSKSSWLMIKLELRYHPFNPLISIISGGGRRSVIGLFLYQIKTSNSSYSVKKPISF